MKYAALDLGSNSFLCLICEIKDGKMIHVYTDDVEIVRLGQGLSETLFFHSDALARAENCLNQFKKKIDLFKPDHVLAMATAAARDAKNKNALFQICHKFQIPLEIISGNKEALITYLGSVSNLPLNKKRLVIDIGGRSTEFICGENSLISHSTSLNIGCVQLSERFKLFGIVGNDQLQLCRQYIQDQLNDLQFKDSFEEILAVAGTPTTLAAVEIGAFIPEKIDGYELNLKGLEKWIQRLQPLTTEQKIQIGFPSGRADVILVGILILIEILKKFKYSKLQISTRGVRYGVALDMAHRFSNSI